MPDFTVMTETDRATIVHGIERGLDEIAKLRAQRDALAEALQFCHDTINANFAGTRTIEERRATVAMNRARTALATLEAGKGPL